MGKSQKAPDPNPGLIASAQAEERLGHRALDISERQFAQAQELGKEQLELTRPIVQAQAEDSRIARERGADQWAQYLSTFKPVEEAMAKDAMGYDSPAEMERRANTAGADVERQFDGAMAGRARELALMGINPASGRFGDDSARVAIAKAAAKAGAMNTAREGVRDRAIALRSGVAAFGRNQPNYAGQTMGQSTASGNAAVGNMNATVGSVMASQGTGAQWSGMANNSFDGAARAYIGDLQGRMEGYRADRQAEAGLYQGLGTAAGMSGAAFI